MSYTNAKSKAKILVDEEKTLRIKLRTETAKDHEKLNQTVCEKDKQISEYQILLTGVSSLRNEKIKLEKEVSSLQVEKLSLSKETKNENKEQSRIIVNYSIDIAKKKQDYELTKNQIESIIKRCEELQKDVDFLAKNKDILVKLETEIQELLAQKQLLLSFIEEKETCYNKRENEIQQLIEKNGRILIETEKNLGTLDIYIKRLQSYYDGAGLNINILEQFNIQTK